MLGRAATRRAIGDDLPTLGPRQGDQVPQRIDRYRGMSDQYARRYRHEADWRKIPDRIVWELAVKADIDGVGRASHIKRVAVRRRLGSHIGRYVSPRPGTVFHQEGLAHGFGKFLGEDARDDIEPAAGGVAHE